MQLFKRNKENTSSLLSSSSSHTNYRDQNICNINNKKLIQEVYEFRETLGQGAFSKVYLAQLRNKPNDFVAIKCIDKKALKKKEESLQNEIKVLRK